MTRCTTRLFARAQIMAATKNGKKPKLNSVHNGATKLKELGPNSPYGALAAEKRPNIRSNSVLTMIPSSLDQQMAVGPKSNLPGLPEDPRDLRGLQGPFGATHGKNRIDELEATKISVVSPFGIF